jgi:hypothetical protein
MRARQIPMRLPTGTKPRQIAMRFTPSAPGQCVLCGGVGWRPVNSDGDRRVTRCECKTDRIEEVKVVSLVDRKSAAAGGDR